ncbi:MULTISPECIES: hypothetical protein [Actinokineospora]|uniref:PE domain-containing protein n=1 Tax=Actinokineospora fastidiosa TaxID=1816 RepID=A0A918G2Z8_9PSEU|nr:MULTISPECIES: hypothetical protein [Actinokineospora]UVS76722.1 hypothetical protein Actkin_00416 [Actinokineospora sp. UTMC 2448]GGS16228.1 hypothetical protein GCM10010171_05500 [Actinokineospora fastidiosa]
MPDGTGTEPTTDQPPAAGDQIDQQVNMITVLENLPFLGPAATAMYSSGGGGEGGRFAISSLAELDALIARWESILVKIDEGGSKLDDALAHVLPPAEDAPSNFEAERTKASLQAALDHNIVMSDYAKGYIEKLKAARADYAGTESENTATVNNSGA